MLLQTSNTATTETATTESASEVNPESAGDVATFVSQHGLTVGLTAIGVVLLVLVLKKLGVIGKPAAK